MTRGADWSAGRCAKSGAAAERPIFVDQAIACFLFEALGTIHQHFHESDFSSVREAHWPRRSLHLSSDTECVRSV